ncbi:hypothetical protein M569_15554 [Genlisea aurea]|uniref:Reverse transcriptase zinc-binding domain-containing protein n=1 Tax=Genlisea aurea TaxID=192259 RepID=S8C4B0_9LAMI|nr:hypothetical protein M569_15554 [Genlisea aurea]
MDATSILSIPLGSPGHPDRLIWHPSRDGKYSVKSGYRHAWFLDQLHTSGSSQTDDTITSFLKHLWKTALPPKIILFAWRLCRHILPTKTLLRRRKICPDSSCEIRALEDERWQHALVLCPWAKLVWSMILPAVDQADFRNLIVGCWAIWSTRNEVHLSPNVMATSFFITSYLANCTAALEYDRLPLPHPPDTIRRWEAHLNGSYKSTSPLLEPEHSEYLAAKAGLQFAAFMGLSSVTLESDCLALLCAVNNNSMENACPSPPSN